MDSILLNPGDPVQDFSLRLSVSAGERNTYQVASADLENSAAEHVDHEGTDAVQTPLLWLDYLRYAANLGGTTTKVPVKGGELDGKP